MKKSKFSEEKIISIIKKGDAGAKVADLRRKHGNSRLKRMYAASAALSRIVADRYRSLPTQRLLAASFLFETPRKVVESSLPRGSCIWWVGWRL
jgi:hypothetical protein